MAKFDEDLTAFLGVSPRGIGGYLGFSPQASVKGIKGKKVYFNADRIELLRAGLKAKNRNDLLPLLERFLERQLQTPMQRFFSDNPASCLVNVQAQEFDANAGWLTELLIMNKLPENLIIISPVVDHLIQGIRSIALDKMSIESARGGLSKNITLIQANDLFSPTYYLSGTEAYIYDDSESFRCLSQSDTKRLYLGVDRAMSTPATLIQKWSSYSLPYIIVLNHVREVMKGGSVEVTLINDMIEFFLSKHKNMTNLNWQLLALRFHPESNHYKAPTGTPLEKLENFIGYLTDKTNNSTTDILVALKAVRLMSS